MGERRDAADVELVYVGWIDHVLLLQLFFRFDFVASLQRGLVAITPLLSAFLAFFAFLHFFHGDFELGVPR